MTKESKTSKPASREGWCPVYDLACPKGEAAATECENRFKGDYNPLTSFRDADIEHCAMYRMEQKNADLDENDET